MHSITIEISESLRNHFNQLITHSSHQLNQKNLSRSLLKITTLSEGCQDDTLLSHLKDLEHMIQMMQEPHWRISAEKAQRINATLAYFLDENDMIPDSTPGLGYLDDCIVISNTKEELSHELNDYLDFQGTRRVYGQQKCVNREDWQEIKKQETASRLRHRRTRLAMKNRRG